MIIRMESNLTVAAQVAALGFNQIGARNRMRFAFAKIAHTGPRHTVRTAPAGKGDERTVKVDDDQYICWEIDAQGAALKGSFASPRAADYVAENFEEIPDCPGHWRKTEITPVYEVPDDFEGPVALVNREGVEQEIVPGCRISVDNKGFCHVIDRPKFDKDFDVFPNHYNS